MAPSSPATRSLRPDPVTLVERYLNGRGLALETDLANAVLRWSPDIRAMVALFRNIMTGRPQAVCRTFLDAKGNKTKRMFLARPVAAPPCSIPSIRSSAACTSAKEPRLAPRRPRPWSASDMGTGSAGAVGAFPILSGIECLTLLQETDAASERAVEQCAARWSDAGREVFINESTIGSDLNDALKEIKHG